MMQSSEQAWKQGGYLLCSAHCHPVGHDQGYSPAPTQHAYGTGYLPSSQTLWWTWMPGGWTTDPRKSEMPEYT